MIYGKNIILKTASELKANKTAQLNRSRKDRKKKQHKKNIKIYWIMISSIIGGDCTRKDLKYQ